jgi:hypothetical protein
MRAYLTAAVLLIVGTFAWVAIDSPVNALAALAGVLLSVGVVVAIVLYAGYYEQHGHARLVWWLLAAQARLGRAAARLRQRLCRSAS